MLVCRRIIIINANPWKYFLIWDPTQPDISITKNVDDATKNSFKISKLFRFLPSNGFVLPIYTEYMWFEADVKTKTKDEY